MLSQIRRNRNWFSISGAVSITLFLQLLLVSLVFADVPTPKHEAGRCAVRGTVSSFSNILPRRSNEANPFL